MGRVDGFGSPRPGGERSICAANRVRGRCSNVRPQPLTRRHAPTSPDRGGEASPDPVRAALSKLGQISFFCMAFAMVSACRTASETMVKVGLQAAPDVN